MVPIKNAELEDGQSKKLFIFNFLLLERNTAKMSIYALLMFFPSINLIFVLHYRLDFFIMVPISNCSLVESGSSLNHFAVFYLYPKFEV